jgi:molybdopterin molybdotransferase
VQGWIDRTIVPLAAETVPLDRAYDRVLAEDCRTARPLPDRDRSAVDGFAVPATGSIGATAYNPLSVPGIAVAPGEALPPGMDAVVPIDFAEPDGLGGVLLVEAVAPGVNVVPEGVIAHAGATLVAKSTRLAVHHLGLLAFAGIAEVPVVGCPRVAIMLAGPPAGVNDSDGITIGAAVARDGGVVGGPVAAAHDSGSLASAIGAADADMILVIGGTGPGDDDHAAAALSNVGELVFHGIALRPGETAGLGRTGNGIPVMLLPGEATACLWSYEMIAGRVVRLLAGRAPDLPFRRRTIRLERKIVSAIGLAEICPVRFGAVPDSVVPLPSFGEIGLMAAAAGDGFVIVPEASEGYPAGASVTMYLYRDD